MGIVSIIFGVVVMFFLSGQAAQNIIFTVIGCGMIYSGLSDLFIQFFLANKFNHFIKAFEDALNQRQSNIVNVEAIEKTIEETEEEHSNI